MKLPASGHSGGRGQEERGEACEGAEQKVEDEEEEDKRKEEKELGKKRGRLFVGGWRGGVKSHRLFSTFSIMTLAWIRAQLLNAKYPGEPIHFVFFGWRAAAVARAEEGGTSVLHDES